MKSYFDGVKVSWNGNENSRHQVDMGVEVGSTDLVLRMRVGCITYFLYLELKKRNGKLSQDQIDWNEEFDTHYKSDNCIRAVAYGFEEAREIVIQWVKLTQEQAQPDV